jgi:hypothetical protein
VKRIVFVACLAVIFGCGVVIGFVVGRANPRRTPPAPAPSWQYVEPDPSACGGSGGWRRVK